MAILIVVCQSEGLLGFCRIAKFGSHELLTQLSRHPGFYRLQTMSIY
jgi:hypothetical protein